MNKTGINKDFLKDFGKAINLDRYKVLVSLKI